MKLNHSTGLLEEYVVDGTTLFRRGPKLNLWRALTDNDVGNRLKNKSTKFASQWKKVGLDQLEHKVDALDVKRGVITADHTLSCSGGTFKLQTVTSISNDGKIEFNYSIEPHGEALTKLDSLPRIGVQCILPSGLETMKWYGKGPYHNYRDRNQGSLIGSYASTVDDLFVNYPYPQENGNMTEVRTVSLSGKDGRGILVRGFQALEASAHHYTTENLDAATHTYELEYTPEIYWNLDYAQVGLGNSSCGVNQPRKPHCVLPEKTVFGFRMEPNK